MTSSKGMSRELEMRERASEGVGLVGNTRRVGPIRLSYR